MNVTEERPIRRDKHWVTKLPFVRIYRYRWRFFNRGQWEVGLTVFNFGFAFRLPSIRIDEFQEWCDELDRIAKDEFDFECECTVSTGRDCWRDYFESGESPRDALIENLSYLRRSVVKEQPNERD